MADAPVTPTASAPAPSTPPPIDTKSSPFAGLENKAKAPPPPKPSAEPPKDGKTAPASDALGDKAKTAPAPAPAKDDRTAKDPKWFREQHEKAQTQIKTYEEKVKALEAKIAEAEARGKDTTVLSQRLADLEKENETVKAELRAARQEVSPEFKEKWEKPFNQSAEYAKNIVTQLQVGELKVDEATGEKRWEAARTATWEDFAGLYSLPMNKAAAMARQMFGEDAPIVIQQLTELHRLDYQRTAALEDEKAKWKENTTKEQAERTRHEQGFKAMVTAVTEQLAKENPHFQDAPGDEGKESRELRNEGYAIFDKRPETIQEAAIKAAQVRHIVAAHYPLVRKLDALTAQLKEAQATIEEMKKGGPGRTSRSTPSGGGSEEDWQAELRRTVPAGPP